MIKEFKIRCSAIGKIMTEPRTKAAKEAGELSETAKSYCELWLKEQLYQRQKEFVSKYTAKGNEAEQSSIDYLSGVHLQDYTKNELRFHDEYMEGTPDIITETEVIDMKNSWDFSTFPLFETEINKDYFLQLQGYMHLTGRKKSRLVYVLSDAPDFLIESEAKRFAWANNINYEETDLFKIFHDKMTYGNLPRELKLKEYAIDYNASVIEAVQERVKQCRIYINSLTA